MAARIKNRKQAKPVKTFKRETEPASAAARRPSFASYFRLVKAFPLVPIRDDAHLDEALAVAENLLKRDLDESADAYLNVLTGLIEAYERQAFPISAASEADILRELMRQHGLSQSSLGEQVGIAQPTISAVLRGARSLTKVQIIALGRFFQVAPDVFLRAT